MDSRFIKTHRQGKPLNPSVRIAILAAVLGLPNGLLGEDADPDIETLSPSTTDCIRSSYLRNFELLDDRNLLVLAGKRRAGYRIELAPGCFGLRQSLGVYFESRSGRICGFPGEYLIVGDDIGIVGPRQRSRRLQDRCAIRGVERLQPEALHELRVRFGKVPPLPPVPEAEVEVVQEAEAQLEENTEE